MRRFAITVLWLGILLPAVFPAAAQTVSTDPVRAPKGGYEVDPHGHTQVLFSILHLGLTDYYGRFDKVSGTLNYNGNQPERSSLSITIDASSIDTPSDRLTGELKGPSVFNTQQFPTANFKSTAVTRTGPDTGRVSGLLTIRNVTKPVTLDVAFNGGEQNPMGSGYALGFRATATIRRSEFGLNAMSWSMYVGDDVHLIIEAMFDQQKS
jgi:polyisoprenoid-binding protein YceI